jgi:cytochrome c oxidase subunit I+III
VLIGGAVFPLFGAWYYWFPKFTGRRMSERLGRWQFWIAFVGFNLAFFPMHQLGMQGMPRRVYTYAESMGWGKLNFIATVGGAVFAFSVLLFIINALRSYRAGALAGDNPWQAASLEWAVASPPPAYNFERMPVVRSREPLWEPNDELAENITGLAESSREVLVTTVVDAYPDHRLAFPNPTIWPFASAIAVTVLFIGSIFTPWAVLWGSIPIAIAVTLWFWPSKDETRENLALEKRP